MPVLNRIYFSVGLTIGTILTIVSPSFWSDDYFDVPSILGGAIIALVFVVDGFQDAKKRNHAQRQLSD